MKPRVYELLPCPFCGGDAAFVSREIIYEPEFYVVRCDDCLADSSPGTTMSQAACLWNRREPDGIHKAG